MAIILLPALVALLGLVVYLAAANPKAAELGRIGFFVGLLWGVFLFAHVTVHVP